MRLAFSGCHVYVQGKEVAADQRVPSMADMVPKAKPQPVPKFDLAAGIKADLAMKAKQVKQLAAKDGANQGWAYGFLSVRSKSLGQVMTPFNSHTSPQKLHWNHYVVAPVPL